MRNLKVVHLIGEPSVIMEAFRTIPVRGPGDWMKDGLEGFWNDRMEDLKNFIDSSMTFLFEATIELIIGFGMPPVSIFKDGLLELVLGGTYGLSMRLISIFMTLLAVVAVFYIMMRKQVTFGGSLLSSVMILLVFGVLFYPLYGMLEGLIRTTGMGWLEALASVNSGDSLTDSLLDVAMPTNLVLLLLTLLFSGTVYLAVVIILVFINILMIVLVLMYPICVAFKPLGTIGLAQFRLATACLWGLPLSLVLMIICLSIGVLGVRITDAIAPSYTPLGGMAGVAFTFVGGVLAVLSPLFVMKLAYDTTKSVTSNLDSKIQAGVDVMSMPQVDARTIAEERTHNDQSKFDMVADAAVSITGNMADGSSAMDAVKTFAFEKGAQSASALSASGGPWVAAGYAGYNLYKAHKNAEEEEADLTEEESSEASKHESAEQSEVSEPTETKGDGSDE